jgi:hypothetical protein
MWLAIDKKIVIYRSKAKSSLAFASIQLWYTSQKIPQLQQKTASLFLPTPTARNAT